MHRGGGQRAEDQSLWVKSAWLLEKYKILWFALVAVAISFGFDFKTPASQTKLLQTQIDTLKAKSDQAVITQETLRIQVGTLLKVPCLDPKRNDRDLQLIGINCSNILSRNIPR